MGMNKSKDYDAIKVLTTILVVVAHATRMYTEKGVITPTNSSDILAGITNFIYGFHMPLFMCVSGMVYSYCILTLGKYNNKIAFVKNKAIRLLIPYFSFGIFYVAPVMVILDLTTDSYIIYCVKGILLGKNSRHLWFIFALFCIFIVCICAKMIMQSEHQIMMLLLFLVISYLSGRCPDLLMINNVLYYLVFFYIGYLLNQYYEKVIFLKKPIMIIILIVIQLILLQYDNWLVKILKALCGIGMVLGFIQYTNSSVYDMKWFKAMKRNAYGVYLFHPMIIYILFYFLGGYNINPYLLCSFIIFIAYGVSYLFTGILRRIKLGILIGE